LIISSFRPCVGFCFGRIGCISPGFGNAGALATCGVWRGAASALQRSIGINFDHHLSPNLDKTVFFVTYGIGDITRIGCEGSCRRE
jgi:hypothetical protein